MPPVGLEPAIPASDRPKTLVLARSAAGISCSFINLFVLYFYIIFTYIWIMLILSFRLYLGLTSSLFSTILKIIM
jgi:hypothetical protein